MPCSESTQFSAMETVKFYEGENKNQRVPLYCIMCGACIMGYRKIHQRSIYTLKQNKKKQNTYWQWLLEKKTRRKRNEYLPRSVVLKQEIQSHLAQVRSQGFMPWSHRDFLHPTPYSAALAPSDCHLLGPLKLYLRFLQFHKSEEMKMALREWLWMQEHNWATEFVSSCQAGKNL